MKNLIIVGARGFGREVYSLALQSLGYKEEFTVKGFLDDNSSALDGFQNYPPIIGAVESYDIQPDDVFICALGSVAAKKHYVSILHEKDAVFINLIHKEVSFNLNVKIGRGCILWGPIGVSNDVEIKDFVTIHPNVAIGHDVSIGNYVHIGAYCFFGGFTVIADEATIYVRATILDRIKIGQGATVGAGSVVLRNVKEGVSVFGNPAKKIEF